MIDKKIDLTNIELPSNILRYYEEYESYANILKKKVKRFKQYKYWNCCILWG